MTASPANTSSVLGADKRSEALSYLDPQWTPLVSGDQESPETDPENEQLTKPSWEHLTNYIQRSYNLTAADVNRAHPADASSSEDLTEDDKTVLDNPPKIFIPMKFRLPDIPLKIRHPQQMELDEGLGVYLPKNLLDKDFEEQLEDELFLSLPSYAEMERYFGKSSNSIPPLNEDEQWIVRKRYSRLCIQYKNKLQELRRELLDKWKTALTDRPDVTNTMIELAAFRRSRPNWRGYLLFLNTFNYRYDFLPNLLQSPLKNPVPFQNADKLLAIIRELTTVRNNPSKYRRIYPDSIFSQYKHFRRKKQIADKKSSVFATGSGISSETGRCADQKKSHGPAVAARKQPKKFA
ncbi:uncharacterized protein LOC129583959 isoform X2 [Paramacrobiotus metropolitanus]|nr:uncharacterized protein LOC129583959 isoform X2 [Paramacrobiotus metropolitanus]